MALTKIKNTSLDDADLIAIAEIGIGTGANQIVQRDSSGDIAGLVKISEMGTTVQVYDADTVKAPAGTLPALDGSALTGIDSLPPQSNDTTDFVLSSDGINASWKKSTGDIVSYTVQNDPNSISNHYTVNGIFNHNEVVPNTLTILDSWEIPMDSEVYVSYLPTFYENFEHFEVDTIISNDHLFFDTMTMRNSTVITVQSGKTIHGFG
jgi:hypothetical protein